VERYVREVLGGYVPVEGSADWNGKIMQKCLKRLYKYQETNLTPSDIADLRNELCLKCGKYKTAHEGSCDGCRWSGNT